MVIARSRFMRSPPLGGGRRRLRCDRPALTSGILAASIGEAEFFRARLWSTGREWPPGSCMPSFGESRCRLSARATPGKLLLGTSRDGHADAALGRHDGRRGARQDRDEADVVE